MAYETRRGPVNQDPHIPRRRQRINREDPIMADQGDNPPPQGQDDERNVQFVDARPGGRRR